MLFVAAAWLPSAARSRAQAAPAGDWPAYGHDAGGTRYAPLAEITPRNVAQLRIAWVYRTGDYLRDRGRFEAAPLVVDGTLYVATPLGRVIALDPARGTERWRYDARVSLEGDYGDFANRGVATWLDPTRARALPCRRRIFLATVDARLIALDGGTGRLRWSWDPVPAALSAGAANAWSVLSADPERDLVFVPTGSASPDFYGGERPGANAHANSVVALRASTGRLVWAFQVVHHDLWDYDVPAQPVLFTLRRAGSPLPAVAVATKMGHLFILDRRTGAPLYPVEERAVPASDVPGEAAWPTQPFPAPALRLAPESLAAADAFGATPEARRQCRDRIAALRYDGVFTPPSLRGTILFPGDIGGMNWSGVAVDERRGVLIAPTNRLAMVVTLIPRDSVRAARDAHPNSEISAQRGTPYGMMRDLLADSAGVPCNPPPWGTLAALDLATARLKWEVPLGAVPGVGAGSINLGGAMITAGGLVFIAGTFDQHLRAFDEASGRELWSAPLPAGAQALPVTYLSGGRQYVVQSAGGHDRLHTTMGDYVVAFTLPGGPVPDTAAAPVEGAYAGEIRVGGAAIGLELTIAAAADSLTGVVGRIDSLRITGPVTVRRTGRGVTIGALFDYPAKQCAGTITATGEQWNGGRLLEGDVVVSGSCSGGPAEHGTLALWRR